MEDFLECIEGNFLAQVTEEPANKGVLLDLILMKKKKLFRDVKVSAGVNVIPWEFGRENLPGMYFQTHERQEGD